MLVALSGLSMMHENPCLPASASSSSFVVCTTEMATLFL